MEFYGGMKNLSRVGLSSRLRVFKDKVKDKFVACQSTGVRDIKW